jgi:signal transduction histidine kinase
MADTHDQPPARVSRLPRGVSSFFAGMRIRKKLIFLHTLFSLILAAFLALALRPAINRVVERAEQHEASVILAAEMALGEAGSEARTLPEGVSLHRGSAEDLGLSPETASRARDAAGAVIFGEAGGPTTSALAFDKATSRFAAVSVRLADSRAAVTRLYLLMMLALLAMYGLVAAALEIFVLPEYVYGPIRRLLSADLAVQEGRRDEELISDTWIPRDEMGEIMRSRNHSIRSLRRHERDLADALARLEAVANDLKRKNHLLETARRNLADADRLASLGMMSAGLAHELNTPLTVLKGLVEKVTRARSDRREDGNPPLSSAEAQLMARVVGRLEKLSESLLDFARVRAPSFARAPVRQLIEEAWTLVSLDREASGVRLTCTAPDNLEVECDSDRMVQVLVNLLRNAVDAMHTGRLGHPSRIAATAGDDRAEPASVSVTAHTTQRESREWLSLQIADNGPGIDPDILPHLFEPFVSTRLDSRGTGLGLAVSEGIIREHGGLLLARNRVQPRGAVFEILLPLQAQPAATA